jgi:negative regulator of sigma E activity
MSNEDLPQSAESASAYLDGELDATERAAAAADPEVMATVEAFTRVRAALHDVDPVVASTKTAALAAALAEFDTLRAASPPAPATSGATATVISLQSRRMRVYRVVTGVAAAVVVGVVAIAALNSTRGNDFDSASSATQAPAADASPAQLPQLKVAAADSAAPAGTAAAGGDAAAQSAEATVPAIDNTDQLEQFAATIESSPPLAATAAAPAPAATTNAPAAAIDGAPRDIGAFSQPSCAGSDQVVLGPIFYRGVSAYAVRNTTTGALQAIDAGDCHVLADVPAP